MSTIFGTAPPQLEDDPFNITQFMIQQWVMNNVSTAKLVKVVSCTNSGGLTRAGTVVVQPLLNQMTAQRNPIAHGQLFALPYLRAQGGVNAVIIDPVAGDIGVAIFCDRDITALKNALQAGTTSLQNPGSFRAYDWADGLYLGGFLNGAPTQYVRFTDAGLDIVSPSTITVRAPAITLDGDVTITGATTGDGEGTFNNIAVSTHVHSGVTSGGDDSGPPVP